MMGRTHALTGALAGLVIGRWLGLDTLPDLLPFATVTAGYALLPDLDHPSASATRLLGPIHERHLADPAGRLRMAVCPHERTSG